jgi:tRNA pseudouridine55 synthase
VSLSFADFPVFGKTSQPVSDPADFDFAAGSVFLIDKPKGWSSFRPVGLLRKLVQVKKVGHAGTLDPMATGLLVLCVGKATKSIHLLQDGYKTYVADIQFGASTPSYDAETEADQHSDFSHLDEHVIEEALEKHFSGKIEQKAPMYSAVKHKGRRLYELAREGVEVERKTRIAEILSHQLHEYNPETGQATLEIHCGKGTYIRSIAHDLGLLLGTHAHLSGLRRTRSGSFSAGQAFTVHELVSYFNAENNIDLS